MPFPAIIIPPSNHKRTLVLVWLAAIAMILVAWWHVISLVEDNKARELESANTELANLTRVSQEHAIRTFRSADQVIRFIQSRYLEVGGKLDLAQLVQQGVIDAELFPQVGIIDAQGIYALANLPITGRLDLSDREHFKVHVAADTGAMFISKPIVGRASGKWSIQLTRRITRPNGEFAGVVVVSIDPGYFTRFYGDLHLGNEAMSALYGLDGIAKARRVGDKEEFGTNAATSPIFPRIAQGERTGSFINKSVVDGVERLYHFGKIPQYPLAVLMGRNLTQVLADHHRARDALQLQAGVVSFLVLALAAALTRQLLQIQRSLEMQRQAQLQLQDRAAQLSEIFELSPDGFVSFDTNFHVSYVSPAFARMTALGSKPLQGMGEQELSQWLNSLCEGGSRFDGIAGLRNASIAATTPGQPDTPARSTITVKGNSVLQIELHSSESRTVSQVLHMRDVTHEFEVDQIKSEFLSTAAHELRTPMASILGFSELLLTQDFDKAEQREFLDIIHKQSKSVATILDELLDLARIESRRGKDFQLSRIDLNQLTAETVKSFMLPEGRNAPEVRLAEQPQWLLGDVGKLRQVLLNVLSNAYKYSPQGGAVRVEVDALQVRGQLPQARVRVTDHGIGMTLEQTERVWERFYRADTSGKVPGTGLGMSIVKEIIGLHRGSASISSAVGQGTCVALCLPADLAQS
jgi:signal transduction histidine kinase